MQGINHVMNKNYYAYENRFDDDDYDDCKDYQYGGNCDELLYNFGKGVKLGLDRIKQYEKLKDVFFLQYESKNYDAVITNLYNDHLLCKNSNFFHLFYYLYSHKLQAIILMGHFH